MISRALNPNPRASFRLRHTQKLEERKKLLGDANTSGASTEEEDFVVRTGGDRTLQMQDVQH